MLENYKNSINPSSLLEAVPANVLRMQMQGFLFGYRAGTTLLFDEGVDADGRPVLKRLEPIEEVSNPQDQTDRWRDVYSNYNPFCAKFREQPERNARCEACDLATAKREFGGGKSGVRYDCHMGLVEMAIPIKINGQIRGVLFGGQRIIKDDTQRERRILDQVDKKAADIKDELVSLMRLTGLSSVEVDAFEQSFLKFARAIQGTVDAFTKSHREEVERESLIEINQQLGLAAVGLGHGWQASARQLLGELSQLVEQTPLWLLKRHGSRFQCVASTEGFLLEKYPHLSVAALIRLPHDSVKLIQSETVVRREMKKLSPALTKGSLIRCDAPSGENEFVSLILVLPGYIDKHITRMLVGCARALAATAGVDALIRRLGDQQENFARVTSFTGHHLKTPIQAALNSLHEAKLNLTDHPVVSQSLERAEEQLMLGMADTMRLQDAADASQKESIDIYNMIAQTADSLESLSRPRRVSVVLGSKPGIGDLLAMAVPAQLRAAFTALLDNAIKYAFESTWVDVRFELILPDGSATHSNKVLSIEIEDVGVGFPPERKEELFSLGTRLDTSKGVYARPGSGIGLVQAKEYIENAGGSLDIVSELVPFSQTKYKVIVIVHLPLI